MNQVNTLTETIFNIGRRAKQAATQLALLTTAQKNAALLAMAEILRHEAPLILLANEKDIVAAEQKNLKAALIDRLRLTPARIEAMADGLVAIAALPDPVGKTLVEMIRPNQLNITRISVPLGVVGVIYESRPNVTVDAAGLCLKAGNAVILRGGSESFYSSQALLNALHQGLAQAQLPLDCIQMIPTAEREAVNEMLKLDQYIDVIIPRGGPALIAAITAESRIPLFKHLAGLCHTYVHAAANLQMAIKVVKNAKMRRPGICGATEVLLIDQAIAESFLPAILDSLIQAGCEVRGEIAVQQIDSRIHLAHETDYDTEFLDAIIAVKIVENIDAAIAHIATHGTQHTDAIITDHAPAAEKFLHAVDSAIVMHNTSTQFADGGEFGMGAEIGIATGKLHARGPVGLEQLTTFKYLVRGQGQVRS